MPHEHVETHFMATNVVRDVVIGMADGRAALVRVEDLWKYYWHLDYKPPAQRPR